MKPKSSTPIFVFSLIVLLSVFVSSTWAALPGKNLEEWKTWIPSAQLEPAFVEAYELTQKGDYKSALEILNKPTSKPKFQGPASIIQGLIYNELGKYLQALNSLMAGQKLLLTSQDTKKRRASHPALSYGFCVAYRHVGNGNLSERACHMSAQQSYDAPESHYEAAQTLMALGKMNEARLELKLAAEKTTNQSKYLYEIGLIRAYENDNKKAEEAFKKSFDTDSTNFDAAYQLAYTYAIQNKLDLAQNFIELILSSKEPHPKMSSARVLKDYIDKNVLDRLPKIIEPAQYHLSRSKAFYKSKKFGLSLLEIETAARIAPKDIKIREIQAGLNNVLFRIDKAENVVRKIIETADPENNGLLSRSHQKLGDLMVMVGKIKDAKTYYQKAIALGDPNNLAKVALKELPNETIEKPPINPNEIVLSPAEGLNRTGEIFAHYGMYKSAIGVYSTALKLNPSYLPSMLNTGAAYFKSGDYGRSITILEKVLINYPTHQHIEAHRILLSRAYVKKGNLRGGLDHLKKLVKINPGIRQVIETDPIFQPLRMMERYKDLMK
jgi:tetratricopeptide (TPR) repeat protein